MHSCPVLFLILKSPPYLIHCYILVKLDRTHVSQLKGLEASVIPKEPKKQTFCVRVEIDHNKDVTRTVHRCQLSLTSVYGFTDYRSQGQTLPYVLVDIAAPPHGKLTLFNLYVALS